MHTALHTSISCHAMPCSSFNYRLVKGEKGKNVSGTKPQPTPTLIGQGMLTDARGVKDLWVCVFRPICFPISLLVPCFLCQHSRLVERIQTASRHFFLSMSHKLSFDILGTGECELTFTQKFAQKIMTCSLQKSVEVVQRCNKKVNPGRKVMTKPGA